MIQRIQSIFLAVLVMAGVLAFVFDFVVYEIGDQVYTFNIMGLEVPAGQENETVNVVKIPLYVPIGLSILLGLGTLFTFSNRALQIKLGRINFILLFLSTALLYYNVLTVHKAIPIEGLPEGTVFGMSWKTGLYMPLAMLFMSFLANRAIRKDEALVNSFDRLR